MVNIIMIKIWWLPCDRILLCLHSRELNLNQIDFVTLYHTTWTCGEMVVSLSSDCDWESIMISRSFKSARLNFDPADLWYDLKYTDRLNAKDF